MATEKVHYVGEPVAAVAAVSRHVAEDALELIEVEIEPLAPVVDTLAAMKPGGPLVIEALGSNVALQLKDPAQADKIYAELSEGGTILMPIAETFWAARFAMFTDKFGTPWMINCEMAR